MHNGIKLDVFWRSWHLNLELPSVYKHDKKLAEFIKSQFVGDSEPRQISYKDACDGVIAVVCVVLDVSGEKTTVETRKKYLLSDFINQAHPPL